MRELPRARHERSKYEVTRAQPSRVSRIRRSRSDTAASCGSTSAWLRFEFARVIVFLTFFKNMFFFLFVSKVCRKARCARGAADS